MFVTHTPVPPCRVAVDVYGYLYTRICIVSSFLTIISHSLGEQKTRRFGLPGSGIAQVSKQLTSQPVAFENEKLTLAVLSLEMREADPVEMSGAVLLRVTRSALTKTPENFVDLTQPQLVYFKGLVLCRCSYLRRFLPGGE